MNKTNILAISLIVGFSVLFHLLIGFQRRRSLHPYWIRPCAGAKWHRAFPTAPKESIREFLTIFVDAFSFRHDRRICFEPDDRVIDIYHAELGGSPIDNMELDTFADRLRKRYSIDLPWHDSLTLGDLFRMIQNHEAQPGDRGEPPP